MENSNLKLLISICNNSIHIEINNHKDFNEDVEKYILDQIEMGIIDWDDINNHIYEKIKELNNLIEIQFYPYTSLGFYTVIHYDVEEAINKALNILENRNYT